MENLVCLKRGEKEEKQVEQPQGSAKDHYDKEDLIQFHELLLSKPLVRACSEMDYEHPTVI